MVPAFRARSSRYAVIWWLVAKKLSPTMRTSLADVVPEVQVSGGVTLPSPPSPPIGSSGTRRQLPSVQRCSADSAVQSPSASQETSQTLPLTDPEQVSLERVLHSAP